MRCLPRFSQLRELFSGTTHDSPREPQTAKQRPSAQAASNVFHDALYQQLDQVKPHSKPARSGVAKVVKLIENKLRPTGSPVPIPGAAGAGVKHRRTGFANIFARADKSYNLVLPDGHNVIRSREEIKTHVLIQNHLKAHYDDPTVNDGELVAMKSGRNRKSRRTSDSVSRTHQGSGDIAELRRPLLDTAALPPERWEQTATAAPYEAEADRPAPPVVATPAPPVPARRTPVQATPIRNAARPAQSGIGDRAAQRVAAFFAAPGLGGSNVSLHDVLKFDNNELESNHQFIQWLFPTDEASKFNSQAPVVSGTEILELRKNTQVTGGLDAGLAKMLDFYGLNASADGISAHPRQQARVRQWLQPGSHHCLRMTRILRSLTLFEKSQQATKLLEFLQRAVSQMPPAQQEQMRRSVSHWKRAINAPTALAAAGKPWTALLFPSKQLSDPLTVNQPGLQDSPVKAALLNKQQALFAGLPPEQVAAPLIGHFSKPGFVAHYRYRLHLSEPVESHAQRCTVGVSPDYYFSSMPSATGPDSVAQSSGNQPFKIHVDFANQAFGGAWRQAHGFAQEEIAFLENTGLGAIAQHAGQLDGSTHETGILLETRRRFGPAFSTRIDGVPSPIVVQGCTRMAQFNSYGSAAVRLSTEDALNALTPVEPETTNWLAIAAPDLRHQAATVPSRASQFEDLFSTAHAGFSMSREIANERTLEVHTGQLGCGVFRNDVTLSTAAQLLAAKLAGVDHVHFHGYPTDPENAARFNAIKDTVEGCIDRSLDAMPRETVHMLATRVFQAVEAIQDVNAVQRGT